MKQAWKELSVYKKALPIMVLLVMIVMLIIRGWEFAIIAGAISTVCLSMLIYSDDEREYREQSGKDNSGPIW